jgi:phosphoribosylamine---glycine ligase
MKVFVIGSGGREHALVWSLARSSHVKQIYSATANAGILKQTTPAGVIAGDINSIAEFAAREKIDLVVVGPEQPLVDGVADALVERGVAVFGPSRAAARLEGSKVFAKEFMTRHNIPTARHCVADNVEDAMEAVTGAHFAEDEAQARLAIEDLLVGRKLGDAGARIVIEECLAGRELSYLVFSDGKDYAPMPVAQDHKRAFDGDQGPNTGGMGAFSTPGLLDARLERRIVGEVVEPTLDGARAEGFPFHGVLYCGLMITADGPKALEYNVRFGDPETQAILRRLDGDFAEVALAVAQGRLSDAQPHLSFWSEETATCVVMASAGYPGDYSAGKTIAGINEAERLDGIVVFHAGTKFNADGEVVTAGGRVLGVTARAATLGEATARAYEAVSMIRFDGRQYRNDIGAAR